MKILKKVLCLTILLITLSVVAIVITNSQVQSAASGKVFSSVSEIPAQHTGLLLGTAKFLAHGGENPYYKNRILATVELFKAKKIKKLIISGDNSHKDYDEPSMMRADLVAQGIDSTKLYLDYAGFRTLDSVVRAKEVFGQESVTVISQQFHNERAIFLAQHSGLKAIGYNAADVEGEAGIKTNIREYFARVKVFIDLLDGQGPHFLGPKVDMSKPQVIA